MSTANLPATAICPGCATMVVLPVEPRGADDPLICGTCGSEVPDNRLELIQAAAEAAAAKAAEAALPPGERRYSRRGLLAGLRDNLAERGIQAARDIGSRTKF
jgi:hypothetical protein